MNNKKFQIILNDYEDYVYSLALYILRDESAAQDIAQDAFTRLWQNIANIEVKKAKFWLMAITRNLCIDQLRKKRVEIDIDAHQALTSDHTALDTSYLNTSLVDSLAKGSSEPEAEFLQHQLSGYLQEAIAKLKEPYHSLIALCDIQQLSHPIVADTLELNVNQVKVYLYRARQQLKTLLAEI